MPSSNGNIFRVTGPLCGELNGHRWIPLTNASDTELWCFLWSARDNREAGDLKRHRARYDVIVMVSNYTENQDQTGARSQLVMHVYLSRTSLYL